jgi:hypothetical protein
MTHFAFRRSHGAKGRGAHSPPHEETTMKKKQDKIHGEGNYKAAREFDAAEVAFVKSGQVDKAAHDAAPKSPAEAEDLARAEQAARERAREEDPAVRRRTTGKGRG